MLNRATQYSHPTMNTVAYVQFDSSEDRNDFGELALPFAPSVNANDGERVVPQQYLHVKRTLASVESILARIVVPDGFQLFAGEENGLVYLLCAVVGEENYPVDTSKEATPKIVYGRRWLLEPSTPTSEVIQTAYLAVQKAREHELREKVVLRTNSQKGSKATPFNCHMDLPLMVAEMSSGQPKPVAPFDIRKLLSDLTVDGMSVICNGSTELNQGRILFDLELQARNAEPSHFHDLKGKLFSVICGADDHVRFFHSLFEELNSMSNSLVSETFEFDGFKRFSCQLDPLSVANFSVKTRNIKSNDGRFQHAFRDMSYEVDAAKAPFINQGELGEQQRSFVRSFPDLTGYLPLNQAES